MSNDFPEIVNYQPSMKSLFKSINYEWLNKYFTITPEDEKILSDPEKIILDGGCVIFAKLNKEIVGTCALIKESEEEYEIAKMGVLEESQGKKVGFYLMKAIIDEARKRHAKLIYLETASILIAAISLYRKFDFIKTTEERIHPNFLRNTFRMELHLGEDKVHSSL